MAESMFDKFKSAFTEEPPKRVVNRDLDPNKAKSFSSVFNQDYGEDDAIKRRMNKLKETK